MWKKRIPFATVMLETVTSVTRAFPATLFVGFLGLVCQSVYFVLWITATMAASVNFITETESETNDSNLEISTAGQFVLVYYMFSYFWTTTIIRNTVHVTV